MVDPNFYVFILIEILSDFSLKGFVIVQHLIHYVSRVTLAKMNKTKCCKYSINVLTYLFLIFSLVGHIYSTISF